jgi:hypothetical protein
MPIKIVPHAVEQMEAVDAFNRRMREGGSRWGFYVEPEPTWIPKRPGSRAWREYHLAVEDDSAVRGAFALKPQEWWIRGQTRWVSDWQGPFSEGVVNPRYSTLALRMIRDMLKKQPLLYSYGHGGNEQPVVQLLQKMSWFVYAVPFCFRVLRPRRFLRLNNYLRKTPKHRLALDVLAYSGAGSIGLRGLHAALRLKSGRRFRGTATVEPTFGAWADELWQRCAPLYTCLAVRDREMMNTLVPERHWPSSTRLRVKRDGRDIGWALVLYQQMNGDERWGNMRVGLIADCFGSPEDAGDVIHAACKYLKAQRVDMLYSNQSHPRWVQAFADNGCVVLRDRRLFVASPALSEALQPFEETKHGLHLTNLDGHGPAEFD